MLIHALSEVASFPLNWHSTGLPVPPQFRTDCTHSDECCILGTRKYFDLLPSKIWDHLGEYPVESFGACDLDTCRHTRSPGSPAVQFRITKSRQCKHGCRDLSLPEKSRKGRRNLPWVATFECPEGYVIATFRDFSRRSKATRQISVVKCKCVLDLDPGANEDEEILSLRATRLFGPIEDESHFTIRVARGESDCGDFQSVHHSPNHYESDKWLWGLDLMALTSPLLDELPELSLNAISPAKSDTTDIPWTELIDLTRGHIMHESGSSAQMSNADVAHSYRACAEAPEATAAQLLAKSFWTPV